MNIMLVCSAGMSTSILVKKMEEAAEEKKLDAKIWAVSEAEMKKQLNDVDVILIGPQVRYLLAKIQKIGEQNGISVDVIDQIHYGRLNGEAVLQQALELAG